MGARILLVDDNEDFLDSTRDVLEIAGYSVTTANSGHNALRIAGCRTFDLTLLDARMPDVNGLDCYLELKKCQPNLRAILVTAYSREEWERRALEAGVLAVLSKPLDMSRLFRLASRAVDAGGDSGRILVVDDDPDFADNLKDVLAAAGYRAATAYSGEEALKTASEARFDLLLLDMKLPVSDGLEVYRSIRPLQPQAVALLVTGYGTEMKDKIQRALDENAHSCLYKPLDMTELLDLMNRIYADLREAT